MFVFPPVSEMSAYSAFFFFALNTLSASHTDFIWAGRPGMLRPAQIHLETGFSFIPYPSERMMPSATNGQYPLLSFLKFRHC